MNMNGGKMNKLYVTMAIVFGIGMTALSLGIPCEDEPVVCFEFAGNAKCGTFYDCYDKETGEPVDPIDVCNDDGVQVLPNGSVFGNKGVCRELTNGEWTRVPCSSSAFK
jgi:hypothetical protein